MKVSIMKFRKAIKDQTKITFQFRKNLHTGLIFYLAKTDIAYFLRDL